VTRIFNENIDIATKEIVGLVAGFNPDLLIAGPAFNAGRYGLACGAVCTAVQKSFRFR
jgi:glycine reductase